MACSASGLMRCSQQLLLAWVLDQPPAAAVLSGQCCDRLRPSFVRRALDRCLQQHSAHSELALVDWRWEARSGEVSGLVLQRGVLQRFRWSPAQHRLALRPQLVLEVFQRQHPATVSTAVG
jgi:hypothetical protein